MASWNRSNLFQTKLMADVEFEVKAKTTGIPQKIAAHRLILASSSPVFERMFNGGFQDNGVIEIIDTDAESFTEFLQLIYDDNVKLTDENVSNVLALIDNYDVKPGLKIVHDFLLKSVKVENSIAYLELALQYKLSKPLIDKCEEIHCEISADVLQSAGFFNAKEEAVVKLLNSDKLRCNEKTVLNAAIVWAKKSLCNKNLVASKQNICSELKNVVKSIRFPIMTSDEFIEIMEEYPYFFNVTICGDILKYIICKRPLRTLTYKTEKRLEVQLEPIEISFDYSWNAHSSLYGRENAAKIKLSVKNSKDHNNCILSLIGFNFVLANFAISDITSLTLDANCDRHNRATLTPTKCLIDTTTTSILPNGEKFIFVKGTLTTPLVINSSNNFTNILTVCYCVNKDMYSQFLKIKTSTAAIIEKDLSVHISNESNHFVTKLYFKRN